MTIRNQLITCLDNQNDANESREFNEFLLSDSVSFDFSDHDLPKDFLRHLVYLVARKPKRIITHVQRIYYCYQANLPEQLFAALVDLLIVLNRRGKEISRRMIIGTKTKLSDEQFEVLQKFMTEKSDAALLAGNQYSVLSKGLIGTRNLSQRTETDKQTHDPLDLAHDYIEYSQLDEAKNILEESIIDQPERIDLHHCLLELYKSTLDTAGFITMYNILSGLDIAMPDEWSTVQEFLNEHNNER